MAISKSKSTPVQHLASTAAQSSEKRPEYIIVFREKSERNTSTMSKVLGVGAARGVSARASRSVLEKGNAGSAHARVYHRLGVAVADLDSTEHEKLEKDDSVAAVVKNELRRIPPIRPEEDARLTITRAPLSPSPLAALWQSSATRGDLRSADPLTAYLLGLRDCTDLLLSTLAAPAPSAARVLGAGLSSNHSWCLSLIGLGENYRNATGVGIRVAVLDTGIDLQHPDFAGRFAGGNDTASFVPGVTSAQDGNGHGTHCAGVIAGAATSSGQRRYSVAPDAELMIGKVLDDSGSGYDDQILDGIDWASDNGARVISMSLGSPRNIGDPYSDPYEVVAGNLLAMMPGTIIIAAAGNESARPSYIAPVGNPAACPSVFSVAAVDRYRNVADFSCGRQDDIGYVDVSAPGVSVYSAWTGSGYKTISGTSMATPHVAGVAALQLEMTPNMSANQLWKRLRELCQSLDAPDDFGKGLIQAP